MIEKIDVSKFDGYPYYIDISNLVIETIKKQNEIIDKVNELDIKLQTVKYFTPESEKAVKDLLGLLEK